jgi:phospholipase/lecithinase/hemolysin
MSGSNKDILPASSRLVIVDSDDSDSEESHHHLAPKLKIASRNSIDHPELPIIKRIIVIGDSLSDRGMMDHRKMLGIISMAELSGLKGYSPDGRFTNGYTWDDFFLANLAESFSIASARRAHFKNEDISDGIISNDHRLRENLGDCDIPQAWKKRSLSDGNISRGKIVHRPGREEPQKHDFTLEADKSMRYHGKIWSQTLCEGGMTSHNYRGSFDNLHGNIFKRISLFFSRLILLNLADMRRMLFNFDKEQGITYRDKQESLIIEWSGANDLITVNQEPTLAEADNVVAARIQNMRKLIAAGYSQFVLFNQPDISLTPRFQILSEAQRENASACSQHLCAKLEEACQALSQEFPHCSIRVFDIGGTLKQIYDNPEEYGFDPAKKTTPFKDSPDFNIKNGISSGTGYEFWDDVHPSADSHAIIGKKFLDWTSAFYRFLEPDSKNHQLKHETPEMILATFRQSYKHYLIKDRSGFFGCLKGHSNLDYQNASLAEIIFHAQYEGGTRTEYVLKKLGLMDRRGNPVTEIPAIAEAMNNIRSWNNPEAKVYMSGG